MTVERYLYYAKLSGLSIMEIEYLTVGGVFDYINEYVEQSNKENKPKSRKATQDDIDRML